MSHGAEDLCARSRFAHNVLEPFKVGGDLEDFFHSILATNTLSEYDTECVLEASLVAGAERWAASIDCAGSLQRAYDDPTKLEGNDVSAFLWYMFGRPGSVQDAVQPWEETDRWIAHARALAENAPSLDSLCPAHAADEQRVLSVPAPSSSNRTKSTKKRKRPSVSHFWEDHESLPTGVSDSRPTLNPGIGSLDSQNKQALSTITRTKEHAYLLGTSKSQARSQCCGVGASATAEAARAITRNASGHSKASSPYFADVKATKAASPTKRPPPGTVPCVPFPMLEAPVFGLIQEEMAGSPFWLLVAVTFLIRTKGKDAVPVLYKIKERFPSAAHIADPVNADDIMDMIRHLGLCLHRLGLLHKYARLFLENPPERGKVYRVKNYDRRDTTPSPDTGSPPGKSSSESDNDITTPRRAAQEAEAWEIGHMTQGKYAIDSWRIFCRDVLLGRASGWNGEGREPEFQPEWMRVRPDDKELRACLRWMWMREGWEWDPNTGELNILREELRQAVNERRVAYDDFGNLQIIAEPRD